MTYSINAGEVIKKEYPTLQCMVVTTHQQRAFTQAFAQNYSTGFGFVGKECILSYNRNTGQGIIHFQDSDTVIAKVNRTNHALIGNISQSSNITQRVSPVNILVRIDKTTAQIHQVNFVRNSLPDTNKNFTKIDQEAARIKLYDPYERMNVIPFIIGTVVVVGGVAAVFIVEISSLWQFIYSK